MSAGLRLRDADKGYEFWVEHEAYTPMIRIRFDNGTVIGNRLERKHLRSYDPDYPFDRLSDAGYALLHELVTFAIAVGEKK